MNGRKTYHVTVSIDAEDEEEAIEDFHRLELRDCDEVEEADSVVDEIYHDPAEDEDDEEV